MASLRVEAEVVVRVERFTYFCRVECRIQRHEGSRNVREQGSIDAAVFGCCDDTPKQELLVGA